MNHRTDKVIDQKKRFIETAKNLACDENEDAFDTNLKKVAKAPPLKETKDKDKNPPK